MEIVKKQAGYYAEVCSFSESREEVTEVIIPDQNPDFDAEISSFSTCTLNESTLLQSGVRASGTLRFFVYYSAQGSEKAYTVSAFSPFSQSFELKDVGENDKLVFSLTPTECKCEMLNSRKIRIKTRLSARGSILRFSENEICTDILEEDGEGICKKYAEKSQNACVCRADKQITFTEKIRLSDKSEEGNIVRWEAFWRENDVKMMKNKLMVRGNVELTAIFASESWELSRRSYSVPFSQVIDCDELETEDIPYITICQTLCELKKLEDSDGNTYLNCDLGASLYASVYRKSSITVLQDAYSTEYETDITCAGKNICIGVCDWKCEKIGETRIDTGDNISSVADFEIRSECFLRGDTVSARHIVKCVYINENGDFCGKCAEIMLSEKAPSGLITSSLCVQTSDISVKADGGAISVSLKSVISGRVQETGEIRTVTDCMIDKTKKVRAKTDGNLILRAASNGETVWSIAKQYKTSQNAVLTANGLSDGEELYDGRLILIPFVK